MSLDERLARLEERTADIQQDVAGLRELLDGGRSVPWERSVRGRLHDVEDTVKIAHLVKSELERINEHARQQSDRRWSRADKTLAAAVGLAVAVGPYLAPLLYH